MANTFKFTTFLVLLSFLQMCYSSRPRPDDATMIISFGPNEQDFQQKVQRFSQKLEEARPPIQFKEGDIINEDLRRAKLYKVQLTSSLSFQIKTIAKELDIKKVSVIPPSISFVTVKYTFPSQENEFLERLKKADIHVIQRQDWLQTRPIFHDFLKYPRDQEYIVSASLKSEAEEIAHSEGILKIIIEHRRQEYVIVKFVMGPDKAELVKKLNEELNIQPREIRHIFQPMVPREYLLPYYAINRFKAIAKKSGISDITYDIRKLSSVFFTFYFHSDEFDFEEKLKEDNIHFEKFEGNFEINPQVNEYIVEAKLVNKVQEIAKTLHILN